MNSVVRIRGVDMTGATVSMCLPKARGWRGYGDGSLKSEMLTSIMKYK